MGECIQFCIALGIFFLMNCHSFCFFSSLRKPILVLPPVEASIVEVMLSPPERDFYNALLRKSQSMFDGIVQSGTVSKSYFAILSLIQRLRQACDHISLTVSSRVDSSYDAEDFKTDNDKSEKETCQSDMKVSGNKCNNLLDDKVRNYC
jgi:DNA repair protein RAD5